MDPRHWDLNQLLAAFEAQLKQSAKDEAAWRRTDSQLRAEPKASRDQRRAAARAGQAAPSGAQMSVDDAQALLARVALSETQYGR